MKNKSLVLVNTFSLVIMLVANYGFSTGKFSNATVADVSHRYDTLFTPAGYAFAIWGVIFLLMAGFVIFQWFLARSGDPKQYIERTGPWLAVSNISNIFWLYCFTHNMLEASVACIVLLLTCLVIMTIRLRLELDDEPVSTILFVWWPIAVYLGWIVVATVANISALLVSIQWNGGSFGEATWAIIMIIIGTFLFLALLVTRNLRESGIVGVWAFIAIAVRQYHLHLNIAIAAIIASSILLIAISIHGYRNRRYNIIDKIKAGEWK